MWKTEIATFIVLTSIILLLLIIGILLFIIQYRRRRLLYEHEKTSMSQIHQRELLRTQLQIQQQTMEDIGREIHDNVGQRLTLASIYANQLLAGEAKQDERLQSIGGIINDSLAELRALSKSLVSADADADELRSILERECDRVRALAICSVDCAFTNARFSISATAKNFVVRIAQESLQNALKHAACSHIDLRLVYAEAGLMLTITDDGKGFDAGTPASGIGLRNMQQRATLIGGTFSINSRPGSGTALQLFIPAEKLNAA